MENIEWEVDFSQEKPQIIDIAKNKQTKIQYLNHNLHHYNFPIKTPFAPGSYIELEVVISDDSQAGDNSQTGNVKWSFIEIKSQTELQNFLNKNTNTSLTTHILLDSNQQPNKQYNVQVFQKNDIIDTNKIGFSLPITRGDAEETFDKYYIVVFVYDTNQKNPTLQDAYITIDMSFRVGVGEDKAVKEIQRDEQSKMKYGKILNSNDINKWNQLKHIYSVDEAVCFLNVNNANKSNQNLSVFDYLRQHPQLAGKIAYIYYRFDLGNEDFIKNIASDNGAYAEDRDDFINKISKVYTNGLYNSLINMPKVCNSINTNTRTHKQEFENICLYNKVDTDWKKLITDFINDICNELNIEQNFRPKIDTDPNRGDSGTYRRIGNTLSVKPPNGTEDSFIDFVDTIIHEFRHFYFWYVFEDVQAHKLTKSSVAKLIYHKIYIDWRYDKIFNAYDKECAIFDAEVKKCFSGKKYSARRDSTPLYFIQPSERDSRVVAWKFRQKAGVE